MNLANTHVILLCIIPFRNGTKCNKMYKNEDEKREQQSDEKGLKISSQLKPLKRCVHIPLPQEHEQQDKVGLHTVRTPLSHSAFLSFPPPKLYLIRPISVRIATSAANALLVFAEGQCCARHSPTAIITALCHSVNLRLDLKHGTHPGVVRRRPTTPHTHLGSQSVSDLLPPRRRTTWSWESRPDFQLRRAGGQLL